MHMGLQDLRAELEERHSDAAVTALLNRSRERPRVGACTLDGPIRVDLEDAASVHLTWPAIGVDVDVIFLVINGPVSAKVRSRIAAGPAEFVVVPNVESIPMVWSELDPQRIERARERALRQGLASLGIQVTSEPHSTDTIPTVAVVGPDSQARASITVVVREAGFVLGQGPEADVVVAVAPETGWQPAHYSFLLEAFEQVGRMVITAPLPLGVCPDAVAAGKDVAGAIRAVVAEPPLAVLPDMQSQAWLRSAAQLDRAYRRRSSESVKLLPADFLVLPLVFVLGVMAEVVVITSLLALGLSRHLESGIAITLAVVVGMVRLWLKVRERVIRIRRSAVSENRGPGVWVRRQLSLREGGQ